MNLREHVNRSFTSRERSTAALPFYISDNIAALRYAAFNIYKRIRVRGVKISETERMRHRMSHHTEIYTHTLYRILYYAIFVLLFLYFYIAFISRDIAIRCYRVFFRSYGELLRDKAWLFNIQFSRSSDLFNPTYIAYFPRLNCNFCTTQYIDKKVKFTLAHNLTKLFQIILQKCYNSDTAIFASL